MKASGSFAKRLSLNIISATGLLFITVALLLGFFSYLVNYKAAVREASASLENNLLDIEKMLTDVEASTNSITWLLEKFNDNGDAIIDVAEHLVTSDTNIVACAIGYEPFEFDDNSVYFCPTAFMEGDQIRSKILGSADYDYQLMDWYLIPRLLGKPYWSEPSFDSDGSGRLIASYSKPLYHENGVFFGVIKADIDLKWLTEKVQAIKPYENSITVLAGRNASYITHVDSTKILNETLFTQALEAGDEKGLMVAKDMIAGNSGVHHFGNTRENGGIIVYGPMDNGWSGAIICSYSDIYSGVRKANLITLLIALLSLVALYYTDKSIIQRLTQPITEFAYSALNIGQGNFHARIPEIKTQDELRRLHDALGYMESSINNYIAELRTTTASNERFESELNIASAIQMQMLPKDFPNCDEIDLYATLHPAKEVGGDLYDFFTNGRNLYFCVGDVSGKGVPAALYMAITRAAFRFIAGLELPAEGVVQKINNSFCDGNDSGMFVTMFVGCINLDTLEMKYCNAGHNPILIISPDGKPEYLHAKPNLAAGLFEDFPYQGETMQLEKGSRLVIYTDGVTEAEDRVKNLYGEDRLEQFAAKEDTAEDSVSFLTNLAASIKSFTLDNDQNDDITMMSIRLK